MSDENTQVRTADVVTLERLAEQMKRDAMRGAGLSASAVASIADIIEQAIGAPLSWPSREAGVAFADAVYPGSPTHRAGFNHGVKWAVQNYTPSIDPSRRYGDK